MLRVKVQWVSKRRDMYIYRYTIDIQHILPACPHSSYASSAFSVSSSTSVVYIHIYYDFVVQVENVINFSPSALTQKSFYDLPFLLCRRVAHFRATPSPSSHCNPRTGLRILIFDKRTGNLSPVSVRHGAARRGTTPQPRRLAVSQVEQRSSSSSSRDGGSNSDGSTKSERQREGRALREFCELAETSCSAQISMLSKGREGDTNTHTHTYCFIVL